MGKSEEIVNDITVIGSMRDYFMKHGLSWQELKQGDF